MAVVEQVRPNVVVPLGVRRVTCPFEGLPDGMRSGAQNIRGATKAASPTRSSQTGEQLRSRPALRRAIIGSLAVTLTSIGSAAGLSTTSAVPSAAASPPSPHVSVGSNAAEAMAAAQESG